MPCGKDQRRARGLSTLLGVDKATIARWQSFWRDDIPQTPFWKTTRARLLPVFEIVALPLSILEAFLRSGNQHEGWANLLRFLAPITVRGVRSDRDLAMFGDYP